MQIGLKQNGQLLKFSDVNSVSKQDILLENRLEILLQHTDV